MDIVSIIDKIYENKNFANIFMIAIFSLAFLFIIVLIIGLKDSKKNKDSQKEIKEEEVKDVSLVLPTKEEQEDIKEDVTFELPVLTDDLENFKKNLEEEIKKEEEIEIRENANTKELEIATRPIKILDVKEIEDTKIINTKEVKKAKEDLDKKEEKKEEPKKPTREELRLAAEKNKSKENKPTVKESKYNSKDNF